MSHSPTSINPERSRFLRGDLRRGGSVLRPPWAIAESAFVEHCSRCGDCVRLCPAQILVHGAGGFPVVDFQRGECTFCAVCVENCRTGVLYAADGLAPWKVELEVGAACLARQGVVCVTCQEQCEAGAIKMHYQAGQVPRPRVEAASCTGCGACVRACPGRAIRVLPAASGQHVEQSGIDHCEERQI